MTEEQRVVQRCQDEPAFFVREVLGGDPWGRQVEIMEAVRDHRLVAVPSCHSSGKSWIAARIVLWFLFCFVGAKVITTAPTERQVKGILWSEIAVARRKARYRLGGRISTTRLELAEDWWAWGFTAPEFDPNRFQGFHAPHILVVVDEAAGVTQTIMEQIDSLLSGGHARKLEIGNPVTAGGPFQASCDSKRVEVLPISAFDTPNFTTFKITEKDMLDGSWEKKVAGREMPSPELISPEWAAERLEAWGAQSEAWRTRVKGLFPQVEKGAYYGELMKAAQDEGRICDLPILKDKRIITAWDIGIRDSTAIWFGQWDGSWFNLIDYYEASGQGLPHYARVLQDKGYVYMPRHIAPPDMANREWAPGQARVASAQDLGIHFDILKKHVGKEKNWLAEGIDKVRGLIPRCRFDQTRCKEGIEALKHYHRKMNARTGELLHDPEHDWASHGADAFRYLALGLRRPTRPNRPRPRTDWQR